MAIQIRQLGPDDAEAYRQLRLEALERHPESFASSYEEESQADQSKFVLHLSSQAAGKFMLGAYVEHELVGIGGFVQGDRPKTQHRGSIVSMYVKPTHTGQQVGRQLLAAIVAKAFAIEAIEQLELEVVVGNSRAEKLYEKAGFRQDAVLKNQLNVVGQLYDFHHMILRRLR